jgi:rRNA maturation endonuclease Nob1
MFDLVDQHNAYYNEYGEELLDDVENIQIRCLSCFRKISLVDHYEHQLCDECMNGVIDHEFDRYDR